MAENQAKISQKERLKEITDSIETGIKDMFESDKYKSYLQTMSRFHKYSLNNTMLIAMQKPDATLVAGFNKWKDGFSRNVKKGEKGIKIIAPVPYKIKEEQQKLDPVTNAPLLDSNGKIQMEEVERQIPTFRVVSVFDVSQTEGKEIPSLVNDLVGNVEHFDAFMEALKRTSPVPIDIKPTHDGSDGYYHLEDKAITIREGMSEIQTISATVHEIAHSKLHDKAVLDDKGEPVKKDRNTEEVEAESISYAVCNYYGIETADNSLGYIANWSKGKELKELKSSLELIGKTSSELITSIDKHFAEIVKERGIDLTKEVEPALSDIEVLATKIDSFARDYDPHGYRDNVENSETHIAEIMDNLRIGKIAEMREYLTDIGDLDGNDTKQAFDLIVELDEFADSTYPQELAYKIEDTYISIFTVDDGYDYSILDKDYNLLDGGQLDELNLTIYEALHEISESEGNFPFELAEGIEKVDFTELTEKADEIESEKIKAIKFDKDVVQANDYHPDDKPIFDLSDIKKEISEEYTPEDLQFLQNYLDDVSLKYPLTGTQISDFVIEGMANNDFDFTDFKNIDKSYFAEAVAMDSKSMIVDKLVRPHDITDTIIHGKSDNIEIEGHKGTWYVVDSEMINDKPYFLLEHEEYGDEAEHLVVDKTGKCVFEEAYNGFDDFKDNLEEALYLMPDPNISISDTIAYGYVANELLPLTKERAFDLYNEDLTIYALYPDNTEAMIFDITEIDSHAGYFGIEKVDWENFYEFKELQALANNLTPFEEKEFLENTKDSFAIYQVKDGAEFRDYRFASMRELEATGKEIDNDNYNLVYIGELQNVSSVNNALNNLYRDFNCDRPSDFKGHSMSVSDIVAIKLNGVVSSHYVDSFGFKEVENYLKTAEISTEQNLNQIDGIINNAPTVADLEQDVKDGKTISLMDLANAVKSERKSVLAELKATPPSEHKEKTTKNKEMER